MANIVLTGINVFENRGTEALAISIVEGLLALPGAPSVTVITRDCRGAQASLGHYGIEIVEDRAWSPALTAPALDKAKFRLKRIIRRDILGRMHPQERALAKADLVVVSGGDIFSSDYTIMERYLRQLDQPLSKGVPVMFFAQSIGPFKTEAERASFRTTANRSVSTVRETISLKYMTETLGIDPSRVTLTADPAFLLNVPDETRAQLMAEYGLEPGTYSCAACSRSISGFTGISHEGHVAAWVAAARRMMELTGKLVLVPHVQMPEAHQDDLALAREIAAQIGDDPRLVVMDHRLHSSVEFKAVLKGATFVVAERTHGAIGAMSSGVPALSVGYSIKAEGVLRQLITDEAMIKTSLVPAPAFTVEEAPALVEAAWNARGAFAAALAETLPAVKARSQANFDIAAGLLAGRAKAA